MFNQKEYIRPSLNGYNFLESYTTALYDERGTFRHNLERYVYSEAFQNGCRMPKTVEEIPDLSFERIQAQIRREEYFVELCQNVMDVFAKRVNDNQISNDDYYEIAGIMGLCPGHCDWHETLFPHLVDLFVSSEEEGTKIWKSVEAQPNIVRVMVDVMSDGLRRGQIIRCNGRDMLSQGYVRNYFRGENAYNVRCEPSMFRGMSSDPEEAKMQKLISILRVMEFALWLQSLSFIQNWAFGDVFHGAIAQHYGIPTNGIDITGDLKTALFFACCKYENGAWCPLCPDEYAEKDSRKNVASRGGDSRYGVLFTAPADTANMSAAAKIPELHLAQVTPIGFQPFMRCSSQSAYIIEAGHPYDLYQDPSFDKFKFRLNPEICEWIYEEMDHGEKVYPKEMFGTCDDIVETIKAQKAFSEEAFLHTLEHMKISDQTDTIRQRLKTYAIEIVPTVQLCDDECRTELENNYWNAYKNHIYQSMPTQFRMMFSI